MRTIAVCLLLSSLFANRVRADEIETPQVLDPRLEISLFAADPQIVTPIGIAVDASGRVLVVESHTHFPENYKGPATDRIRSFEDTNGDGRADRITTFFAGTRLTMNLAVHHDGSVYVATRSEVFRLQDRDGDGKAEVRTPIVRLETKGEYPHNGLSGFAFDFVGNIYFGFGENLGESYRLIGSDGHTLTGGGEGGNVYRCAADGSGLVRIATGFWNPFHLCLDRYERLFAVDNDPDSRPPCRLLHVVEGGDYGFRFKLGRKGLHPFISWNGEVPGTLPMVAGTGEAPSGILAYESDHLPGDYRGDLLVTSWGDHRIERHRLAPHGASVRSKMETIIHGGEDFRPVGIALAADGSLFITDWVKRDYHVHGKGRIWHIRAKKITKPVRSADPTKAIFSLHRPLREAAARKLIKQGTDGIFNLDILAGNGKGVAVRATAITALSSIQGKDSPVGRWQSRFDREQSVELRAMITRHAPPGVALKLINQKTQPPAPILAAAFGRLTTDKAGTRAKVRLEVFDNPDAFLRQAARRLMQWQRSSSNKSYSFDDTAFLLNENTKASAAQRLSMLLVWRASGNKQQTHRLLPALLRDNDPRVRTAAMQWIAEENLTAYRDSLAAALTVGVTTRALFDAYLAAIEMLDRKNRQGIWTERAEKYVVQFVLDKQTPADVRVHAIRILRPDHPQLTLALLSQFAKSTNLDLQIEAIRSLRGSTHAQRFDRLRQIAANASLPKRLRAEAVMGLDGQQLSSRETLLKLTDAKDEMLRDEALRSLRSSPLTEQQRNQLSQLVVPNRKTADLVRRIVEPEWTEERPAAKDLDAWEKLLVGPADAAAGERLFFRTGTAQCIRCHQMQGRGGLVGPDLSITARRLDRRRLIESIVDPSKEVAPQFVASVVQRTDGTTFTGVFLGEDGQRNQRFADAQGQIIRIKAEEIEQRRPLATSIMPSDLTASLTLGELRDLLAFLGNN